MTVFLYLNDVEEGGGTYFKDLDITVQPKTGRAVVWPSVRDEFPDRKDPRTSHEALPVKKGIKYGGKKYIAMLFLPACKKKTYALVTTVIQNLRSFYLCFLPRII